METIFDVLKLLNNSENTFYLTSEGHENLIGVKKTLTNIFQDVNFKKIESVLKNVRNLEKLSGAGDWHEKSDVFKILCEDVKGLYKEYKIKKIQNEIQ